MKRIGIAATVVGAVVTAVAFPRFQRWQRTWGLRGDEATAPLPGDEAVPEPAYQVTRAIDVAAAPQDVFVWLRQMGSQRGGLYSYDVLDRLFGFIDGPSVEEVVPEWQHLQAGDIVAVNHGPGWPVFALEDDRVLVYAGADGDTAWLWSMVLRPDDRGGVRFLTRNRIHLPDTLMSRVMMFGLDLAAFVMVRKWLLRIRELAERRAAQRASSAGELATAPA